MARKTKVYIAEAGRDAGKQYLITEMPSAQAESWALRAFLALANSGIELPEEITDMGMEGIASLGIQAIAKLRWEDAKPLLDEMMGCVKVMPDPSKPAIVRPIIEESEDIEELATYLMIRKEVFTLHVDFFDAVKSPTSAQTAPKQG